MIEIKDSNKGKFTEQAKRAGMGVQEFAKHVLANNDDYDPTTVKRANFARNAKSWVHKGQEGLVIPDTNNSIVGNHPVVDYFKSYADSSGYDRIVDNMSNYWKSIHPYRRFVTPDFLLTRQTDKQKNNIRQQHVTVDENPDFELRQSYTQLDPNHNDSYILIGTKPDRAKERLSPYENSIDEIVGHEYGHTYSELNDSSYGPNPMREIIDKYYPNQQIKDMWDQYLEGRGIDLWDDEVYEHDIDPFEKYADIQGLRYMLYKSGIYDSRSNRDATIDDIRKARKLYPDTRIFKELNDEQILMLLNHIAYDSQKNNISYAKQGGLIKRRKI